MSSFFEKQNIKSIFYTNSVQKIPDLKGKFFAITGTTSGTGYVAAKTIAQKGGYVFLLNRSSQRQEKSFENLKKEVPEGEFISINCDLQSFASVKKASHELIEKCPKGLDALCNNAGIMAFRDIATEDGFDIQMQTNHLSHFLLTKNMMPLLDQAAQTRGEARIINHSSIARFMCQKLLPQYLEKKGGRLGGNGKRMILFPQGRWVRYAQTKIANAAFTAALKDRLHECKSQVKAVVAHPGFAFTHLQKNSIEEGGMNPWLTKQMIRMKLAQSQEDGALGIITCMTSPHIKSGDFLGPGKSQTSFKGPVIRFDLESFYNNKETKELLWKKSCEAIGESFDL